MVEIAGRAGLFLTGQVSPTLEGVEISIKESGATNPLITVLTDETGSYRYLTYSRTAFIYLIALLSIMHISVKVWFRK